MTDERSRVARRSWPEEGVWVVGVDGSPCSAAALDWAVTHSPDRATGLHLVTAWQTPIYGPHSMTGPITVPYDVDALEAAAHQDVDRLADETRHRVGVPVESIVVHAGAATALLDASAHGSLLVVGTRGRGGFTRLLLGSTSNQCATHAHVPTAVIPEGEISSATELLVGLDGSPNSLAAFDWALHFASPGSTITVTWVWDASPLAVGADEFFFPDASDTAEERFEHLIDEMTRGLDPGIRVHRKFVRGRPRAAINEHAEHADLVVLGARGHGAVGAALLGSVSSWALHHIHRPMVIVPDRQDRHAVRETETTE